MTAELPSLSPARYPGLALGPPLLRGATTLHLVLDRRTGRVYELGIREYFILARLDGTRALSEVADDYAKRFGRVLRPADWPRILAMFAGRGLLADGTWQPPPGAVPGRQSGPPAGPAPATPSAHPSGWQGGLRVQWRLVNPAAAVDALYRWLRWFFSPWVALPLFAVTATALALAGSRLPVLISQAAAVARHPWAFLAVAPLLMVSIGVHELGHCLTARHFGGRPSEVGVRFRFVVPMAYCIVPDAIVFPLRRQGTATAAAGAAASLAFQVPFAAAWLLLPADGAGPVLGCFLLVNSVLELVNYLPWPGLDGYQMLSHALGVLELHRESWRYARRRARNSADLAGYPPRARPIYLGYLCLYLCTGCLALAAVVWLTLRWVPSGAVLAAAAVLAVLAAVRRPGLAFAARVRGGPAASAPVTPAGSAAAPGRGGAAVPGLTPRPGGRVRPRSPGRGHQPVIRAEQVRKAYQGVTALAGVSLSVRKGEIFCVAGPGGAGKTTLIEIMAGLRRPDSGSVTMLGRSPWPRDRSLLPRFGVQTQAPAFFRHLTALEHLETLAALYQARTVRPADALELAGLSGRGRTRVSDLSAVQRQRLAIASALVHDPGLVFLDEPAGSLPPQDRMDVWEMLDSIGAGGRTVVCATRHISEAAVLCDRIALIRDGSVVVVDTPENLVWGSGALAGPENEA